MTKQQNWFLRRSMEERLRRSLDSYVKPGDRLLVAVSGGPDSVALTHLLRGMPFRLILGHVDHRIRRESAKEARFVERLGAKWDLPVRIERVHAPAQAARRRIGLEEAARDLRYKALLRIAQAERCDAILTAHTANDQAETVLMNFLRGAGPSGLAGIPPRRPLRREGSSIQLLRPVLGIWKDEIMLYLRSNSLRYRHDPTNDQLRFRRNRIRHRVLPWLEHEAPGLADRLIRTAAVLREEEDFWDKLVASKLSKTARKNAKKNKIDLTRLFGYHKALVRRIFRHLKPGLSFQDVEKALARLPLSKRIS